MIRHIDNLNRISLTREVSQLGWEAGTALEVEVNGDGTVTLRAKVIRCALCGQSERLVPVTGKHICIDCLEKAAKNTGTT